VVRRVMMKTTSTKMGICATPMTRVTGPTSATISMEQDHTKSKPQSVSRKRADVEGGLMTTTLQQPREGRGLHFLVNLSIRCWDHSSTKSWSMTTSGGMFSEPVPRDQYPEYYEQIKKPMDYGTMKEKLESGEYRSAQAMQKDFILVMQNCVKFNAPNSDVVREARQQALMRPTALRNAAKKFNLFLAEDGSVLEIIDDEKKKEASADGAVKLKRKRRKKGEEPDDNSIKKPIKRRRTKKKDIAEKEEEEDDDTISEEEDVAIATLKKPRIRISLNGYDKVAKKVGKKRKKAEMEEDEGAEADVEKTPAPKKKRGGKKKADTEVQASEEPKKKRKKAEKKEEKIDGSVSEAAPPPTADDDADGEPETENLSLYMNVPYWKSERAKLDGTFKAANALVTKHGPWKLPEEIGEDRFTDVALAVLSKMAKHDHYSVFAEAVTVDEAPDYYDIVKKPMDFGKMSQKIENKKYGFGSAATAALYEDFKLVFNNCNLYNDEEGDVLEEATRLFSLLPETYAMACRSILGKRKNIKDRLSKG
jgi:Bromodomain